MKLPKLYRVVKIKFWSLTVGVGSFGGVMFDIDVEVERLARRVRCSDGWKWQLITSQYLGDYWALKIDTECLANSDLF